MMTSSNGNIFRVTGPLCGEFTGPGEFPTQRPVTRGFDVFFDLRINGWVNNRQAGDLRRHRGHYNVSVMRLGPTVLSQTNIIFKTFSSWDPTSMQQTDGEHVPRTDVVKSMRPAGWSFDTTWYHMGSTNQSALNTDFTTDGDPSDNWPNSQISECTCSISHNAPFRTEMCTFLLWMKHCGIWNRCILGFLKLIYLKVS